VSGCSGKRPKMVDSIGRLISACRFAFDCDNDGFACSRSMETSNLSLSQSNEYHHPDSRMGKKEANCHVNFVVEEITTTTITRPLK
jgi:hypothetical protein